MRSIVILIAGLFSFSSINLRLFRKSSHSAQPTSFISTSLFEEREKLKKRLKKYKNRKYKKRQRYKPKHYKLAGTMAKDNRYSNQKRLRRMYRNC